MVQRVLPVHHLLNPYTFVLKEKFKVLPGGTVQRNGNDRGPIYWADLHNNLMDPGGPAITSAPHRLLEDIRRYHRLSMSFMERVRRVGLRRARVSPPWEEAS